MSKEFTLEEFNSFEECLGWCVNNKPIVKDGYSTPFEGSSEDHLIRTIKIWWSKWKKVIWKKPEEVAFEKWCIDTDNDTDYENDEWSKFHWLDGYKYALKDTK
tara:strand:- start:284 stop:592 length:309 start_codon:yes stop_codon:yes gene_type:complete